MTITPEGLMVYEKFADNSDKCIIRIEKTLHEFFTDHVDNELLCNFFNLDEL